MERLREDALHCPICYDRFRTPKILSCFHTFCEQCLERHLAQQGSHFKQVNICIVCPKCRDSTYLPAEGIAGLRDDVAIEKMSNLSEKMQTIFDALSQISASAVDNEPVLEGVYNAVCGSQHIEHEKRHLRQLMNTLNGKCGELYNKLLQIALTEKVTHKDYYDNIASLQAKCSDFNQSESTREQPGRDAACAYPDEVDYEQERLKLDERFGPTLAQLMRQQNRLYGRYAALKVDHDIVEEILDKCADDQIAAVSEDMISIVEQDITRNALKSNDGDLWLSPRSLLARYSTVGLDGPEKVVFDFIYESEKCKEVWNCELLWHVEGRGEGRAQFDWPVHANFLPSGDVIVCDKNNKRLQILSKNDGKFVRYIGLDCVKPKRVISNPVDGLVYVSDEESNGVKVFNENGSLVNRFGHGLFKYPAGIAVMSNGNVVMCDSERSFITVHSPDGILINKFCARIFSDVDLPSPHFLCVDEDDNIIVTDSTNNCVKVYNKNGRPLYRFGQGKLNCPRGLCLDLDGNIAIADSDNHRIAVFDPFGKYLRDLLSERDGLQYPMSVEMDDDGRLVLTQCGFYGRHEVRVYQVSCSDTDNTSELRAADSSIA
ncbi:E3 ubiquitin-protein ligase TRIM32-like [Tubulanus polymorphus]|uniref:E3 ubiquitin-protein ligase TRIM32-like n=1 Tax=Tubulanus polymorphus TaxID=672921 RepID=UPI003DA26C47